ncbi:spermatogenesis-associated protein 33 [Saccopteryx bilineata]|uniref:spermatogenesis-associated protein 33 n=1 Tax=Saccopteryx bilineata TaxID=59482 RepID=UPI00338F43AD
MGLGRSKHKPGQGGEQKKGYTYSEKPLDTKPAEGFSRKKGTAKQQWPSPEEDEEKPEAKVKSSKRKTTIPQIIITRASNERLVDDSSIESEEQRTIQEKTEWGPYSRHRNPSTVDAYVRQSPD